MDSCLFHTDRGGVKPTFSMRTPTIMEFINGENGAAIAALVDAEHQKPWAVLAELYRLDVLGTRAFRPLAFRVRHLLAFMQVVETDALKARRVEKQVFSLPRVDEPEASVRQPFDAAFGHLCVSQSNCLN
jgi:hypothetical protein